MGCQAPLATIYRAPAGIARSLAALIWVGLFAGDLSAQPGTTGVVARAQALVAEGNAALARSVLDSMLADTDPSRPAYAEALYWRGVLSTTPSDTRKDLLRLVVEFPLTAWTSEALFRLAQGEIAAGNRPGAIRHLERLVRDHAGSVSGPAGAFQLGQMLLEAGDLRRACPALDSAMAYEPGANVETRNRIAYARRPCAGFLTGLRDSTPAAVDTARSGRGATSPTGGRGTAPATTRGAAVGTSTGRSNAGPTARGATAAVRWTVQVAALASQTDASALAARLKARGYDSRVTTTRPYRVRIGRFATHAEATAIATKLRAEKTTAIVVEAERP